MKSYRATKVIRIHPRGAVNVYTVVLIHAEDTEISNRLSENIDLLAMLKLKSGNHQNRLIHPLGTMTVCTNCHGNENEPKCELLVQIL